MFKVSTTTSNFMIGVTAAASAVVYLHEGTIDPTIDSPVMLGYLVGALLGARIEICGQMKRGLAMLKMRGSIHDKAIRQFTIDGRQGSAGGFVLGDVRRGHVER